MDTFDDEGSDGEIFINSDAKRRFTSSISSRGMHYKGCFTLDQEDANMGLPGSIGSLIKLKRRIKLCQQPDPYNTQMVTEFYYNLIINKRNKVMWFASIQEEEINPAS
ncbi:hypothetical protein RYX36_016552 [Vicia faba]